MLQVSDLSKAYATQVLFDGATFSVNPGERVGLVGRNGEGKTTLFRLLTGEEQPDSGEISKSQGYNIGHLSQHLRFTQKTALEEAALGLPCGEDHWQQVYKVEAVLQGLGFSNAQLQTNPSSLSGGFQVRLNLAKLIVSAPNLLLLDEPTNYLDIVSLRWLTKFLQGWQGELILITHDHQFMDQVTTHTLGIHRKRIRKIEGDSQKYYAQLELEERINEQQRLNQEKKIQHAEKFINTFRAKASKAKSVQSRIKALERMDKLEKLDELENLDFSFTHKSHPGKRFLEASDLAFSYEGQANYLFENLSFGVGPRDRLAVIGANGKGKSTLLRVLAGELTPSSGSLNLSPNLEIAYFGQTNVERLNPELTVEEELLSVTNTRNRTVARTVAGQMMFSGDAALKKIKVLSGGERARVLLGKLLLTPANLLILDEPTNHLDMGSTDALCRAVQAFPGAVLIVTHSEMLLDTIAQKLIVFDRGGASVFTGGYQYFLSKVGWEGEGPVKTGRQPNENQKRNLRKYRAEIIQRRSAEVRPLEKEAQGLEKKISLLEARVVQITQELIELTREGFGDEGAKLSRELHASKHQLNELYEKLEQVLQTIDERSKAFDQELSQLPL